MKLKAQKFNSKIRANIVSYEIRPEPKKIEIKNEDQARIQDKNIQIKFFMT